MRGLAACLVLIVALPYGFAVFIGRVPQLRTVKSAAGSAYYLGGKSTAATVKQIKLLPSGYLGLYQLKFFGVYYRRVTVLNIVLRYLTLILLFLFRKEINREAFL